jgi:hypothetical protein
MSVSFKTGDPAWNPTSFDTIRYSDGTFKYHDFLIEMIAAGASSTSLSWAPYDKKDHTSGYWKRKTLIDGFTQTALYSPNWSWTTSSGTAPSALQYPFILYHVNCPTCKIITNIVGVKGLENAVQSVSAYPSPANSEVTISFSLADRGDVSVVLYNLLGEAISTQTAPNILNGKATINTSNLPAGVYVYAVSVGEQRTTGKVVIAH